MGNQEGITFRKFSKEDKDTFDGISFHLHQKKILEFKIDEYGRFDVIIAPDIEMTEAAKGFIEVLRDQIPKLRVTVNPLGAG